MRDGSWLLFPKSGTLDVLALNFTCRRAVEFSD